MKKTRILSVVAVLCLLLGMFAGAAVAEETPELKKIGVAFMKNDPFMVPLYNGMKEVCDANGIELIEYYAENDIEKQISQCDDLLQQDIDGLIVMPVDFEGITPALDAARKAGVPVVSVDAACADAEKTIAYIASDNYKAGCAASTCSKRSTAPRSWCSATPRSSAPSTACRASRTRWKATRAMRSSPSSPAPACMTRA